jgi:hypothetical protein
LRQPLIGNYHGAPEFALDPRSAFKLFFLAAAACLLWTQPNAARGRVRVIILYSRHLGAHGMGYNGRSLRELSQKLSPADIPTMIALLADRKVRVGAQFALATQCEASIVPVREAARRHEMHFLDASHVMDMISSFPGCPPDAKQKARAMRDELDKLGQEDQAKIAAEAKRKAENDARIQQNGLKLMDPNRARELTRQEREEVYHHSLKAIGLDENGPLTPAQKQMVERMYRTMVLGEFGPSPPQ